MTKLQAYRRYREQASDYWTLEKLEETEWEWLCSQVPDRGSVRRPAQQEQSQGQGAAADPRSFLCRSGRRGGGRSDGPAATCEWE